MPESIQISGNVAGSVVIGDNNFVVNTNHGTIVYQQPAPQVQKRTLVPAPPRAPRGFVNRSAELARIENWIRSNEIVLLYAPDGLGKTSLLKQAANSEAARAMPDGVILLETVDASGQALGPEDVVQRLFDALFESNPPLKVNATTARTYLSNTRPLVLFDEVPLTPALQNALPDLLPQGALILAADLPTGGDFERLSIKPLPRAEALSLLADKAAITINNHNRLALDALCALLDDAPLALTITGNLLRETADSPDAALSLLRETPDSSPDPLRCALDRTFAYAFSHLSVEEQRVLSAAALTPSLSVAPDWLSFALGEIPIEAALERLQALGLLYTNSPRLRLPPGFRAQARHEAAQRIGEQPFLARLAEYLLANQSKPGFIAAELGNFAGALAASQGQTALALARAIDPYLILSGLWDMWGRTLEAALESAKALGNRSAEAWALHQMGTRLIGLGQKSQASLLLNQALKIRESIGDTVGAAYSRYNLTVLRPAPVVNPAPSRTWLKVFASLAAVLTVFVGIFGIGMYGLILANPPSAAITIEPATEATETIFLTVTPSPTLPPTVTASPTLSPTPDTVPPRLGKLYAEPDNSYYGESAERCKKETSNTLFTFASDLSGIRRVDVVYWYQYSTEYPDDDNPRYRAEMKAGENGQYSLLIDHNNENRAEVSIYAEGGWMLWQVTATDASGNQTTQDGPPIPLTYAWCDTSAPRLEKAYTQPGSGTYGDFRYCTQGLYSSYMELHIFVQDESTLRSVTAQYYYQGKLKGTIFTLNLYPYRSDPYHFYNFIDHNANAQAEKTLNGDSGQFIWQVTAIDEYGNATQSLPYTIEIFYQFCPSPG